MFTFLIIMRLVMVVYSVPFLRDGIADTAGLILNPMQSVLEMPSSALSLVSTVLSNATSAAMLFSEKPRGYGFVIA